MRPGVARPSPAETHDGRKSAGRPPDPRRCAAAIPAASGGGTPVRAGPLAGTDLTRRW